MDIGWIEPAKGETGESGLAETAYEAAGFSCVRNHSGVREGGGGDFAFDHWCIGIPCRDVMRDVWCCVDVWLPPSLA